MAFDRKSLGFKLIAPSLVVIAVVFFALLFLIKSITVRVHDDYVRFTLASANGEVRKVLTTAANDLTAALLAGNDEVTEAKQKSVMEALRLLWSAPGHGGVLMDSKGAVLYTTLPIPVTRIVAAQAADGYRSIEIGDEVVGTFGQLFPMWGWKVVTVSRVRNTLLQEGKIGMLVPLVATGCVLMVFGIFLVLRKNLQRPVESMVAAVSSSRRVEPTGVTEFDIVGNVVNDAFQRLTEQTEILRQELAERTRIQEELRAKDERIHNLLDCTEEGIFGVDPDGVCTFCNRSCLQLLGYRQEEDLLGKRIHDLIHPPGVSGETVAGEDCPVCNTFRTGAGAHLPAEVLWRADGTALETELWAHPVVDDGRICGAVVTFIDATQRKLLEDQLIQAQKMESIGRLAGGIAHDFNNLLTPIMGYCELLRLDLPENTLVQERCGNMMKAAGGAKELVQQLLSFSRKQVLEMKVIDLNQAVGNFQSILRRTIRESIDLKMSLAEGSYPVRADKNQIEQVVMNLVVNAQDAIGEHGVVTIETAPVLLDDEYARLHKDVIPGRYLMLAVADDGCGMDQETRQRVFEPFFTTKGIGKGTGLGLATVYGIVRQHGGNIWVYSEPGKGTVFKCYFPLAEGAAVAERADAGDKVSLEGARRTILLVEDNEMVRLLVAELLAQAGFEMLIAGDPKEALKLSEGRRVDLLVTDVVLPHMSGPQLHRKLLQSDAGLKVLYMSGYTSNAIVHQGVLDEGTHYIAKPFALNEFARKVAEVLAASS
ncbi:ATP-binding protein [Geomonas oryzae]|uniref:ATP-binding protein n=1 Tax=Geomonas oryzae TaxID=2364273 RepID=UPI00100B7D95|nr:ATP-binding protein [Geomonas oryzae]